MKTFEQRKFKRKLTLGEYLKKRIESGDEVNTTFHLIKVPSADELEYYIQQYKIKEGHSEWSETYKRNFWVEDEVQMAPSSADIV
jgi:hypothetical protein